ncbi:MAG: YhbY family RNA-binding protein [Methanoculleaceae archaeon]
MTESNNPQALRPTVWIGKQGCTGAIMEEIRRQLEKRRVVKVRWLRSARVDPGRVADRIGADLLEVRGRTMTLARRRG